MIEWEDDWRTLYQILFHTFPNVMHSLYPSFSDTYVNDHQQSRLGLCAHLFFLLLLFASFLFPPLLTLGPFSVFIFTVLFLSMWGALTRVRTTWYWSSPSSLLSTVSRPWPWSWVMLSSTFSWSRPWPGPRIISPSLSGRTSALSCVHLMRPWPGTRLPCYSILSFNVCCVVPSFVSVVVRAPPWWSWARKLCVSRHWSLQYVQFWKLTSSSVGNKMLGANYISKIPPSWPYCHTSYIYNCCPGSGYHSCLIYR